MFDANACAIELLKMKNSEDIKKKVAVAASTTSSSEAEGACGETSLKNSSSDPVPGTLEKSLSPEPNSCTIAPLKDPDPDPQGEVNSNSNHSESKNDDDDTSTADSKLEENCERMEVDDEVVEPPPPPPATTTAQTSSENEGDQQNSTGEETSTPATSTEEPVPSTSSAAVINESSTTTNGTTSTANLATANDNPVNVVNANNNNNEDRDRMSVVDSSTEDEEDEVYASQFTKDNMGSGKNNPTSREEQIIKQNTEYLFNRFNSLMKRVQGIMQTTAARHISRQLKAVLEYPPLSQNIRNSQFQGKTSSSSSYLQDNSSETLTKQSLAELQFTGKLMTNIIRHSMGNRLDLNNDSATEESDSDDDEVVPPDDRLMPDPATGSGRASYLPMENNPFIDAIKVEKQYEARRTSIDYSINECEFSLTKSMALKKHCKASKPVFQLKKPAASSNVINIPVDPTSSVKFYHDRRPVTTRRCIVHDDDEGNSNSNSSITSLDISRVSDMIQEQDKVRIGPADGNSTAGLEQISPEKRPEFANKIATTKADFSDGSDKDSVASQEQSLQPEMHEEGGDQTAFIPSLKTLDSGGVSVLGVEFVNNSDPNQSSSRCSAIKRPDKNRKVFQLGGIQNIFRDPSGLPTVGCTCYGKSELCALCLGRAQKKAGINHVFMDRREKLSILDETFHKSLSFSEDVPLEVLLTSGCVEGNGPPLVPKSSNVQQLIKNRSQHFPPDFLETGPRPKKPRSYDIKPYVETPIQSPKKDGRFSDESLQAIRKRTAPRKSQSSFDEREGSKIAGKGLGWPSRERKDSMRRTRNQEFDIDNIVIPYSIAAATRVEQLVYKPIETPRWRVLDYAEIFATMNEDKNDGELEDMSNAAFLHRHNKCEIDEKKRFTQSLQKALNATRKTRRLDSTGRSESISEGPGIPSCSSTLPVNESFEKPSSDKLNDKEKEIIASPLPPNEDSKGVVTPVPDNATVITEAMATQALKSLFKVGRRRTISTSTKPEEEEETPPPPPVEIVDPWPQRKFPLTDDEFKEMVETMQTCDLQAVSKTHDFMNCDDSLGSPGGL